MKFVWLFSAAVLAPARAAPTCADWSLRMGGDMWDSPVVGAEGIHRFSLPPNYDPNVPMPLILYFHGWGGGVSEGNSFCNDAGGRGYACIQLEGIGRPGWASWNGFGSTESSLYAGTSDEPFPDGTESDFSSCAAGSEDEAGRTCNLNPYGDYCNEYQDCNGACADDCWWTTKCDSVQQTVDVLNCFSGQFNIDLDRVFASGCSNGGMFTFELASDARTGPRLAAIATQVGLPHYGFNFGPVNSAISMIGMWGSRDTTVPPLEGPSSSGCTLDCRTSEPDGWFYTSWECTVYKWAGILGLTNNGNYDAGDNKLDCELHSSSSDVEVVGCIFNGGHTCNMRYQRNAILDFFDVHPKTTSATTSTITATSTLSTATSTAATSTVASTSTLSTSTSTSSSITPACSEIGDLCGSKSECCSNKCTGNPRTCS